MRRDGLIALVLLLSICVIYPTLLLISSQSIHPVEITYDEVKDMGDHYEFVSISDLDHWYGIYYVIELIHGEPKKVTNVKGVVTIYWNMSKVGWDDEIHSIS